MICFVYKYHRAMIGVIVVFIIIASCYDRFGRHRIIRDKIQRYIGGMIVGMTRVVNSKIIQSDGINTLRYLIIKIFCL